MLVSFPNLSHQERDLLMTASEFNSSLSRTISVHREYLVYKAIANSNQDFGPHELANVTKIHKFILLVFQYVIIQTEK